jgi:hypothetical protein
MTTAGFDSGGFLASDVQIDSTFDSVAMSLDGRPFTSVGAWTATGSKASTTAARGTDPKLLLEAAFSDFDFKVDVGLGDTMYLRYLNESNWLRVSQYMVYSESSFACNPYACNPYACNPVACNPVACNPYACNPYACNPYACNPYSCNCVATYVTSVSYTSNKYCKNNVTGTVSTPNCRGCGACCDTGTCPPGSGQTAYVSNYCLSDSYCTTYTGDSCQTCYQTCYETCFQTCYQTCYSTCYSTCYDTCYQTCYNYFYPTYVRLEKMVAGTLTLVSEVNVGTQLALGANADSRVTFLRAVGKGANVQVFCNRAPTTALINATVAEHTGNRKFGVGRQGYGNQDSGNSLDNLSLKNAK